MKKHVAPHPVSEGGRLETLAESGEGSLYSRVIARARKGTASPRTAIKAFCLECVVLVRKDVSECTETRCPLWRYRPYQEK